MSEKFELHLGDCLDVLRTMPDASIDSIVTDPPYHLTQVSRGSHARTNNPVTPHARARIGDKGFMGKVWDGGDIAHRVELWAECLRVLKPGGHLLAFAGSRTYHRMTCAIEDAGFEIRDQIMWIYGSGFPKSKNLSGDWQGWGTALKPAHEPICMARKPFACSVADNVIRFGTGALNIDASRVGDVGGRWPANVVHDGSDEVLEVFPDAPGQLADVNATAPSPKTSNVYGAMARVGEGSHETRYANVGGTNFAMKPGARRLDAGSAARFFYCAKASRADRNEGIGGSDTPAVQTEATMRDREMAYWEERNGNFHPTVKPTDLMAYLCRLVTPAGGLVLDVFMGSGSTGKAAIREGFRFVGIDMTPEYVEIARARIAHECARVEQAARDLACAPVQAGLFEEFAA
ncbi:site-specific DNA-methyltransferase [Paraburkholderia sp. CNPSo 3157]|uniref:Methyltransferase n=1 Tax=Paraburkholderia franconis TaxID=2654983 RepID=A0A7X1TF97_9BURK|nr:site-specific DNA-methyltransferase [Paraburkholderia franconis]MPW16934.1 site-specific DNA-methyltransferase [Paraburkholderia franconis]